jgi:hypothetical protein
VTQLPTTSGNSDGAGKISAREVLRATRERAGANPYAWAHAFRVMPDGMTYSLFNPERSMPYLYEPYIEIGRLRVPGGWIAVMKCVQVGWSELAINSAFWFMDVKREPVLYMLRTDAQLGKFVLARIDSAILASPYIAAGFAESDADSVGLKIGWGQSIHFRGAEAVKSLVEFSAGLVIHDEKDAMNTEGIAASYGRREGMINKWAIALSNPSIPEHGIHIDYMDGSQGQWALWCDKCQEFVIPQWPESANRDHPYTPMCPGNDHELDKRKGQWIHQNPGAPYKSYHMDHFSSPRCAPIEMLDEWERIHGDPTKTAAFYNLRLGLPWAEAGTQITDTSGLPSMGDMVQSYDRQSVMGVDVGTVLHVVIRRSFGGILWVGTLNWDELGRAMSAFNVENCAIDVRPETTKAQEFGKMFPGRVVLVEYNPNPWATEPKWGDSGGVPLYSGLRTPMMDAAVALVNTKTEGVPSNLPAEFWEHLRAVSRQYVRTDDGKVYVSYVASKPDHYAHAFTYSVFAGDRFHGTPGEQTQFFSLRGRKRRER